MDTLKKYFQNRIPKPEGFTHNSAVLALVMEINAKPHIILTKRALHMVHQPGDFCFPGGRSEGLETPLETALRETYEELGIPPKNIEIFGECDFIISQFGAYIRPFFGKVIDFPLEKFVLNKDEVDSVLPVPLEFFLETKPTLSSIYMEPKFPKDFPFHLIEGGENYKWGKSVSNQWFYNYKGNIVWGLTARIINNIKEILK
ncbi:MAG: NUDIX hydrolase [Anaerotignaceae bacterium]